MNQWIRGCIVGVFLLGISLGSFRVESGEDSIVVIVNKSNAIGDISSAELSRIYSGKNEKWSDGQRIVVINRPYDSRIRQRFYKQILNAEPTQKFFKPGSPIPFETMVLESGLSARKFVGRIPNAVAYVLASEADESVNVLNLEGERPEAEHYKLK